jgi:hypothetical protein
MACGRSTKIRGSAIAVAPEFHCHMVEASVDGHELTAEFPTNR